MKVLDVAAVAGHAWLVVPGPGRPVVAAAFEAAAFEAVVASAVVVVAYEADETVAAAAAASYLAVAFLGRSS